MPYIYDRPRREVLACGEGLPQDAAELNFVICDLADSFLTRKGVTYAHVNEVMGAIECAKLEIYRRVAAPFEDQKAAENGDVFHVAPPTADLEWQGGATYSNP